MGAILFGNIQKHLSINGVETLVFSRKIVIYQSVFQKQILKNLFVVIEASKAGGTKERIDIKQVAGVWRLAGHTSIYQDLAMWIVPCSFLVARQRLISILDFQELLISFLF